MGELTDEDLVDIEQRIGRGLCYRCDGLKYEQPGLSCPACDGTGMFALSATVMLLIITELRERRAQDLRSEERADLEGARDILADSDLWQWPDKPEQKERAIAIIERLLTRGNR